MEISFPSTLPHWIGGKRVFAKEGAPSTPKYYAATGEVLCHVPNGDADIVEAAVQAAEQGFKAWSAISGFERGKILSTAAKILYDNHPELARLEVLDTSKPLSESLIDQSGADCMHLFAGLASTECVNGKHIPVDANNFVYTRREPLGICLGIGAWNYPLQIACWKTAPALACGNSIIYKPSDLTPLTALRLGEILAEAGVPGGVFNVVHGARHTGGLLTAHAKVSKISLTGSVETGKAIMRAAADTLKPVTLELGGKSPLVVFDDAHMDNAVRAALNANFACQGEVCSNGTRVLVHNSIKEEFVKKCVEMTKRIKIGDPMDESTTFGALISADHRDKVRGYIEGALKEGCSAVINLSEVSSMAAPFDEGYFLGPVIFVDPRDEATVVREEVFGPVMCVQGFDSEEEGVARANATPFGLAAAVFTRDIQRAHRVAAQLEAGTCWINEYNLAPPTTPFGGRKLSGFGKECGPDALNYYSQIKSVYVAMDDVWTPY